MTGHDDHPSDMPEPPPEPPFDESTADALLSGARPPADAGLARVADVLDDLRSTTKEPAAPPSPALASVLRDGLPAGAPVAAPTAGHRGRALTQVGWRRMVAPIGLGLTLTTGSLTVAAAADVLPDPAQRVVAGVVNAITPLELPEPGRGSEPPGSQPDAPTGRGEADAPGGSAGQGPGTGADTPGQLPVSPGGTSLPSPPDGAPAPFPDPPGAPSAGTRPAPLPGAPGDDVRSPLPVPAPPPAVGTPGLPTTPTTVPLESPTTPTPPRLPAP